MGSGATAQCELRADNLSGSERYYGDPRQILDVMLCGHILAFTPTKSTFRDLTNLHSGISDRSVFLYIPQLWVICTVWSLNA